jgi:hypothetical protein
VALLSSVGIAGQVAGIGTNPGAIAVWGDTNFMVPVRVIASNAAWVFTDSADHNCCKSWPLANGI